LPIGAALCINGGSRRVLNFKGVPIYVELNDYSIFGTIARVPNCDRHYVVEDKAFLVNTLK
jgi:hypothetical protein